MTPLWGQLLGAVRLRVSGAMPERLINLCLANGMALTGIRKQGDALFVTVLLRDFFDLRPLARRARCRIKVVARYGLPFTWNRLRRRRLLLVAAAAVLIGLYVFGSFIWFLEVHGHEELAEADILRAAAAAGLAPGVWRPGLDRDTIAQSMISQVPALAWVGIEFIGTKAIVTVVERRLPPDVEPAGPGDIIAERAGVIERLLVLRGEPAVTVGDTVLAGQLLIKGVIAAQGANGQLPPPGAELPLEQFQPVRARGEILARTWRRGYLEVPLVEQAQVLSGRSAYQHRVAVGSKEFIVGGVRRPPFVEYETELQARPLPSWAGAGAGFRLVTVTFHELTTIERQFTPGEALAEARQRLERNLLGQIDADARILGVRIEESGVSNGFAAVAMTIDVLEDIGKFQPLDHVETPPDAGGKAE